MIELNTSHKNTKTLPLCQKKDGPRERDLVQHAV
jgi:hypothetical protein